jgi:DNA-binding MarR family transcriptional regulator
MMKRQARDSLDCPLPAAEGLDCVGYRVRRLSRMVSAIYDDAFGPLKLKISQFGILVMLSRRGPSSAADLCRVVMMDKSTASRNLQRMRRRGWVSVAQDRVGHGQKVSLTQQGRQILQQAFPLWRRAQEEATRRLGTDGVKALELVAARMKE